MINKKNIKGGGNQVIDNEIDKHLRRIDEITIPVILKPEEAIEIAKDYHKVNELDGVVNEEISRLFFDEEYTFRVDLNNRKNDDKRPAWKVIVDLPENRFLFEDYMLIVSDKDRKVMGMLDCNGQPVLDMDEDTKYIMNDDDDDNEVSENWKGILKSFDDDE